MDDVDVISVDLKLRQKQSYLLICHIDYHVSKHEIVLIEHVMPQKQSVIRIAEQLASLRLKKKLRALFRLRKVFCSFSNICAVGIEHFGEFYGSHAFASALLVTIICYYKNIHVERIGFVVAVVAAYISILGRSIVAIMVYDKWTCVAISVSSILLDENLIYLLIFYFIGRSKLESISLIIVRRHAGPVS